MKNNTFWIRVWWIKWVANRWYTKGLRYPHGVPSANITTTQRSGLHRPDTGYSSDHNLYAVYMHTKLVYCIHRNIYLLISIFYRLRWVKVVTSQSRHLSATLLDKTGVWEKSDVISNKVLLFILCMFYFLNYTFI